MNTKHEQCKFYNFYLVNKSYNALQRIKRTMDVWYDYIYYNLMPTTPISLVKLNSADVGDS